MRSLQVFFSHGFRPFFLMAGLFAALAIPLWILTFLTGTSIGVQSPLQWHIHEMLFGYFSAALAGFLLTAVPNWTRRKKVGPAALVSLFVLWLFGRASFFILPDAAWQAVVPSVFIFALAFYVGLQVIASGNTRNLIVVALITALGAADFTFMWFDPSLGIRMGFSVAVLMIGAIGGRIIPAFTGNWLKARSVTTLPAASGRFDAVTMLITLLGLGVWIIQPDYVAVLAIPGVLQLIRLMRWRALSVTEPLILMLHAAFLWVPAGLILLALSGIFPQYIPFSAGAHALGAGAVSLMTLTVMMRATLGHSGLPLVADKMINAAFGLVFWGAILRVGAVLMQTTGPVLHTAALLWSLGFMLFVARFLAAFFRARVK